MTKAKVLIPVGTERSDLPLNLKEYKDFTNEFDVEYVKVSTVEQFRNDLHSAKLSNVSAYWETSAVLKLPGGFNQFIDDLPKSLKIVAFPWVGANAFDAEKLKERGIILTNIGDASAPEVADIALSLTLSAFRFTSFLEKSLRDNDGNITQVRKNIGSSEFDPKTGEPVYDEEKAFDWFRHLTIAGKQLQSQYGKVAGLVGFGSIGKAIAKRLDAIGLQIKYTKRSPLSEEEVKSLNFDVEYVKSFEELIPQIDLLVLAVPHTPETIKLVNEDTIKLFKKGVRIVNIGRGSAIDEDVLFKALDDGTVTSVGLDVFVSEPQIDKRFLKRPDVSILPHTGAFAVDTFDRSAIRTIENIKNVVVEGGKGINPIN